MEFSDEASADFECFLTSRYFWHHKDDGHWDGTACRWKAGVKQRKRVAKNTATELTPQHND
jgi:hypothetical protein